MKNKSNIFSGVSFVSKIINDENLKSEFVFFSLLNLNKIYQNENEEEYNKFLNCIYKKFVELKKKDIPYIDEENNDNILNIAKIQKLFFLDNIKKEYFKCFLEICFKENQINVVYLNEKIDEFLSSINQNKSNKINKVNSNNEFKDLLPIEIINDSDDSDDSEDLNNDLDNNLTDDSDSDDLDSDDLDSDDNLNNNSDSNNNLNDNLDNLNHSDDEYGNNSDDESNDDYNQSNDDSDESNDDSNQSNKFNE